MSSIGEQWNLIFAIDATRATGSPECGDDAFVLKVAGTDLVRRARDDLFGREHTILDEAPYPVAADPELRGSFQHRKPFTILLGGAIGANAVPRPQCVDTLCGPGLPLSSDHSHPVQRCGDLLVGPSGRHAPHHSEGRLRRAASILTGFWFAHPQLRMLAAPPMDRQNDLARLVIDIGDDVDDESSEQALASAHGHAWCVPGSTEVIGKTGEVRRCGDRLWRPHCLQSRFASLHAAKRGFPALLELRSDQAIVGIAGSVPPLGE